MTILNNYYLLRRLAQLWNDSLSGAAVVDIWCHAPGELVLALNHNAKQITLSFLTHAPIVGVFQRTTSRPRRNAKSLFCALRQQRISGVQISEHDRILNLHFTSDLTLEAHLYGSRANVLLANHEGRVQEAFRKGAPTHLPAPRDSAEPKTLQEFQRRWNDVQGDLTKKLQRVFIRFSKDQCAEVVQLLQPNNPSTPDHIFKVAQTLHGRLLNAEGPLYVYQHPPTISVISLTSRNTDDAKQEIDIDEGIRKFAQNLLSERAYRMHYDPLRKSIIRKLDKAQRSAERMKHEYHRPSLAETYEQTGHILMASPRFPAGERHREIEDVFHPGTIITVTLDPALDSYQNAERYYSRAQKSRTSRNHLHALIKSTDDTIMSLKRELETLDNIKTYKALKSFQKSNHKPANSKQPFKRYPLSSNYEVWVGRNAKENEALTLKHARPFDLWLHARGVSGAHTLLRLPKSDANPSQHLIEQAAAIAAWHSKARTSRMAPVIVTPKKYVQKARGASIGEVSVIRENVVMVEPALP